MYRNGIKKIIVLSKKNDEKPLTMFALDDETNNYFNKAPAVDILQLVLTNKVVLVEGPSEYILFDKFYKKITNNSYIDDKISVLDIKGLSFKRYLEVAKLLKIRVAVITDNDKYENNRIESLKKYEKTDNIKIFTEKDKDLYTFEVALHSKNKDILNRNGIQIEDMLRNKTDIAFTILKIK